MCGIIGIAGPTSIAARERAWLSSGSAALRHRGPDDCGEWWSADGTVGLGHRRLAIIDLTPAGHQPMSTADGDCHIVFNGEIYNFLELRLELASLGHGFRSHSDTEVILAAYRQWGTDCLERLNGMFAFAIYDARRRELFLARDRAGEKPLFYELTSGTLRFASELKGLFADGQPSKRIDMEALDCFLAMGYVPGERCIVEGISKLPPAHALTFDTRASQLRTWRYWRLPDLESPGPGGKSSEPALLEELERLLADSVRRQLVADVPVGVLLSGGVDSSLVTAMAVRAASRVKTFTIRFPGFGKLDETDHARLIARHFSTEHLELDAANASVELLPLLARQFDEPLADSSMIPTYLVSKLIREHCTVALGGDGGDELFAGYPQYNRLLWTQHKLRFMPRWLGTSVARTASATLPIGVRGRNWLQSLGENFQTDLPLIGTLFDRNARERLMENHRPWKLAAEAVRAGRIPVQPDLLQRATRMDFENYLAEDILVKVDRASMLSSLEVRAPLLDHRLIEFAFAKVPTPLKATTSTRKVLLKKLVQRVLPPAFELHRKQGFSIPLGAWLKGGAWLDYFRDILLGSDSTLFSHSAIRRLLDGQAKGLNNNERLFALVLFELWRREYRMTA